jgi:RHS repeat-associated protein
MKKSSKHALLPSDTDAAVLSLPQVRRTLSVFAVGGLLAITCANLGATAPESVAVPSKRPFIDRIGAAAQSSARKSALPASDGASLAPMSPAEALASTSAPITDEDACADCNPFASAADHSAAGDQVIPHGLAASVEQRWDYDQLGNITFNTYRGTYHYEDPTRPMRVTKVTGGSVGTARVYQYDAVGNQTVRADTKVVYNENNLPARILRSDGTVLASFLYAPNGARVRKTSSKGTVASVGGLYELHRKGPSIEHRLIVPGVAVLGYKQNGNTVARQPERYLHTDHLGSTIAITADDDPGAGLKATVKEVRSYDAFGLARNPDWKTGSYADVSPALSVQGYTGHNDDTELGLIDMKGRIYDPLLGRFLTTDPLISDMGATQPWHPYAYVRNNPLRYTDPSGFMECVQHAFDGSCIDGGGNQYSPAVWDNVAETQRFGDARDSCSSGAGCFDENRLEREYERKSAINEAQQTANTERALKQHQEKEIRKSGGTRGHSSLSCGCDGAATMPGLAGGGAVAISLPAFVNLGKIGGWLTAAEGAALSVGTVTAFVAMIGGTTYYVYATPDYKDPFENRGGALGQAIDWLFGKAKDYILQSSSSGTPKAQPKQPGPTVDKATGQEVGVFVVDPKGNTMIQPKGGSTVPAGKLGENTHTRYPNGSTYHRLDPLGHGGKFPGGHGHGHQMGTGPGKNNEGSPIDPRGNPVPANSPDAHWSIK